MWDTCGRLLSLAASVWASVGSLCVCAAPVARPRTARGTQRATFERVTVTLTHSRRENARARARALELTLPDEIQIPRPLSPFPLFAPGPARRPPTRSPLQPPMKSTRGGAHHTEQVRSRYVAPSLETLMSGLRSMRTPCAHASPTFCGNTMQCL